MKPVSLVTIGFGWTAAIIAAEATKAGVSVLCLERGNFRDTNPDFSEPSKDDELAYSLRQRLFQDASRDTYTLRNDRSQTALPIRQFGAFLPGEGVGGAGVHWNGVLWRYLPWDFETRSRSIARYGPNVMGEDCTSQDWGITYRELEPYYTTFDKILAVGGKAGNLSGQKIPGGNIFEGPRSEEFPNPPMKTQYSGSLYRDASEKLGYHPFPQPSANSTTPYLNYYGVTTGACVYCGFCEGYGCEMYAKASPQVSVLPFLRKSPHFELRTNSRVQRIELDSAGKKAIGVTYIDAMGREIFQPAETVFLCGWGPNNIRMLLLSKIGTPYDPRSGKGTVGRNYAYQCMTKATAFFRDGRIFNNFMGAGAVGIVFDDFNGDNFDHRNLGFIGGADIFQSSTGARPIETHPVPKGTPRWGSAWKAAVAHYYSRSFPILAQGGVQAYRGNYCDLDPTYRDVDGQPLMRITFDWGHHEHAQSAYMAGVIGKVMKALGTTDSTITPIPKHFDVVPYQTTHNTGGTVMGTHRDTSVVNKYGQSWDVHNVFVTGSGLFPQNAGYNPTGTIGALTLHTADAFLNRYLKHQGSLA